MAQAQTNALLDAALTYAAKGWHVFPCHTPTAHGCSCRRDCGRDCGKHPRTRRGLNDATTDEGQIRRWWTMWPSANVAIRTGQVSGLVVLDRDDYKGGADSLEELEGTYSPLPETVLSLTGGGGQHYGFAAPGTPVKTTVESFAPGLDIKGEGGYVIAPPSLHMSGKQYVWEVLHEPEDTPLAPMPDWLRVLCQEKTRRTVVDAGAPIPDHQRNDTLFRHGCSFRAKGCTEAVVLAALREMNATQCQPPLTEAEVEKIVKSIAKYEAGPSTQDLYQRRNGDMSDCDKSLPLPYSDYTNALAFVREHGQNLRYCYPWKAWLVWTGTHWQRDMSGAVMRLAKHTVKRLARHAEDLDDEAAKALMAHVKSSLSTPKLKALVENAQSEPGIAVQPEALDTHPWLLNCLNGTLDLTTGTLRAHDQAHLLTVVLPVAYDATATAPIWHAFLERIMAGNQNLIRFLQRAIGYALTGVIREHVLLILWGKGRNGKSTFLNIVRRLLGAYAMKAPSELLMVSNNDRHPTERADLWGKRFVSAIETEQGQRLAEVFVKEATGGDPIRARRMREDFWEFQPTHKVFLATNHKPVITGTDAAIWERIKLVPFTVTIPEDERDTTLPEKLEHELPGLLNWALQGCRVWQQEGLGTPDEVRQATAGYQSEMDVLGQFIEDCCLVGPNYRTKASDLYEAYKRWCDQQGVMHTIQRTWGMALTERGYERKRGTAGAHWWVGLGLTDNKPPSHPATAEDQTVTQVTDSDPKNGIHSSENFSRGQNRNPGSLGSLGSLRGEPSTQECCPQCRCTSLLVLGAYRKCPLCNWKGTADEASSP